jgi:hypothetical protein
VTEINPQLEDQPDLVRVNLEAYLAFCMYVLKSHLQYARDQTTDDCYVEGWLMKMQVTGDASERDGLLDAAAYMKQLE